MRLGLVHPAQGAAVRIAICWDWDTTVFFIIFVVVPFGYSIRIATCWDWDTTVFFVIFVVVPVGYSSCSSCARPCAARGAPGPVHPQIHTTTPSLTSGTRQGHRRS